MTPKAGPKLGKNPFVASREKDTEEKAMHRQRMTQRNDELECLRRRYAGRGKEGKRRLLDKFCEHHGYERKYAIKLLQGGPPRAVPGSRPGPETKDEPVQEGVERIGTCAEQLCGKRLAPGLGNGAAALRAPLRAAVADAEETPALDQRGGRWTGCWPTARRGHAAA